MGVFYGQVKGGAASPATRTDSKRSRIRSSVQSYDGSLIVEMQYIEEDGKQVPYVHLIVNEESDFYGHEFFSGTLDDLVKKFTGKTVKEFCKE